MKEKLSTFNFDEIKNNYEIIRKNIDKTGRRITLLAATKTVPANVINYAVGELGITDIGENRVQELLEKYEFINKENVNIHFIGSLQTNKVKYIIDKVSMIHSLDNYRLAEEIEKRASRINRVMDVLVEINIGEEPNKSGILPDNDVIQRFIDSVSVFSHVNVRGLMTLAPICNNYDDYTKYFEKTYKIFIDIFDKRIHNINESVLSMGMSDSYMPAVMCGSNLIRVGTALFGNRS